MSPPGHLQELVVTEHLVGVACEGGKVTKVVVILDDEDHSRVLDTRHVAKLASDPTSVNGTDPAPGATKDVPRDVGDLATEMRRMVTLVIGYLELISDEGVDVPSNRHLKWIDTIERRLE